ncbi:MAG: 6-bladed beta-propeller [Rubrivivax sp.]|nr:6-bladed beta-propeller [Rubrivivax sp.]
MTMPSSIVLRLQFMGAVFAALAWLAGCTTPPTVQPQATVFYPPPPDAPRIQHLATFANARDLTSSRSGFADFVLGAEGAEHALVRPYGATLFEGKLYVADSRAPGLVVFDLVARKFAIVEGAGAGRMQRPINVTIDTDGTRYITDTARNQVLVYDRGDRFVAAFGDKGEFKPVDTLVAGDRLYVVDIEHHEVRVLDKRTGKLLFKFGKPGSTEEGALFQPTNLALAPDGDIYVVETGNFRVSRFTRDGKFVRRFGESGQAPGNFARPKGIAVDRAGRVYVSDAAFQNVQVFDDRGRVLMVFGQPANGAAGLNLPAGVAIDYDNVALFQPRAAPGFKLEYVILVVSQFGPDQVDVFGFGRMEGASYPVDDKTAAKPGG